MSAHIKLITKGFPEFEKRIIDTTVRLSANKTPKLSLVDNDDIEKADVIFINPEDELALKWAKINLKSLVKKTTVWVHSKSLVNNPLHTYIKSPVMWVNLPIIIARILDEQSLNEVETSLNHSNQTGKEKEVSRANKKKLLVVDDSKAVRDHLVRMLEQRGYEVASAEEGESAIEQAKAALFDCVFMDVLMPGIDGYKACREIRKIKNHDKQTPVVMLTSRTSPFDKIRGKMAGCDAYLTKPVQNEYLLETLNQLTQ